MKCPVCAKEDYSAIFKKEDLRLIKCRGCGLVLVDDPEATFDIRHYDYYKERIAWAKERLYNPITACRYVSLLTRLERYRKNNALLDIGCGEGHFLSVAKGLGWEVKGLEVAPYAVDICKRFDINVECADLLRTDLPQGRYDLVTMFEVLEHMAQPREYLLRTNALLRKGGVLVLTTPNFDCITRRMLRQKWSPIHKEHLFYYAPRSVRMLINSLGYKIIEFRVKTISLPEIWEFLVRSDADKKHVHHQNLRRAAENNALLTCFKNMVNSALNLTGLGEAIECVCQKV